MVDGARWTRWRPVPRPEWALARLAVATALTGILSRAAEAGGYRLDDLEEAAAGA